MAQRGDEPEILILSGRYDISTDYVVSQLRSRRTTYLRINTEDLPSLELSLNPTRRHLEVRYGADRWSFSPRSLRAVYFRRPVFLREFGARKSLDERFAGPQWSAFERSLMLFSGTRWMNRPDATYGAEIKPVQLAEASDVGFDVPDTLISNSLSKVMGACGRRLALKPLETVYIERTKSQTFAYTQLVERDTIGRTANLAPAIYQEELDHKLDARITVVGNSVFAATITDRSGRPIAGDWRLHKARSVFHQYELPDQVRHSAIELTKRLGLAFGGIDIAIQDGRHYFIEINPTGEWSWLVDAAGLPIDRAIAEYLADQG